MLEALRKGSSNIFIKVFLGALALSFVMWGIGDVFRGGRTNDIATVGDSSISYSAYQERLQKEISRIQNMFGSALTPEQIAGMRLQAMVIGNLVNRKLIELETASLGVQAGNDVVINYIQSEPTLRGENGAFEKARFDEMLQANRMTEQQFFVLMREGTATEFLTGALNTGTMQPRILIDLLYAYRNEKRKIDVLHIPSDYVDIKSLPEPSNAELIEFHERNQDQFSVPEYRSISYITIGSEDVMDEIEISDEALQAEYDYRIEEFQQPERRSVEHMLFDSEEAANKAVMQLEEGKDFITVAKDLTGKNKEDITLGLVREDELFAEVKETVFSLSAGGYSLPIKGPFGWYVFRVTEIKAESTQTFSEVSETLRDAMKQDKASEALYDTVNAIEDALASGDSLEDVVQKFSLMVKTQDILNAEGKSLSGEVIKGLPETSNFFDVAFASASEEVSPLTLFDDNSQYFAVRVDAITSPRIRALDEVRGVVIRKWKEMKQREEVKKTAQTMVEELGQGKTLATLAKNNTLKLAKNVEVSRPQNSSIADTTLPKALLEEVFGKVKGKTTSAYEETEGGYAIAGIKAIVPATHDNGSTTRGQIANELKEASENDVYEQYNRQLRQNHPVAVKSSLMDQAVQ